MRCLDRNKKPFYYANYSGKAKILDSDGYFTGEYGLSYTAPVRVWGNISPARGTDNSNPFGITENYDKIIVMNDPNIPIEETSVLWVEKDITEEYDYVVVRTARSLNSVSIAIRKVDVNA